jgi:hypothetical protein
MFCLSYYCLYFLFKKIRDKTRTESAWKRGGWGSDRGGRGRVGEMAQIIYAHMNKQIKKKKMWYLYTIEFYSAMKKTEIFSFVSITFEHI